MKKQYFILTIALLLLSILNSFAQQIELKELIKRTDESLNKINTVTYKIDHYNKYLARKDTLKTTAICSLYIAPKDKMKAYNIVDMEYIIEGGGEKYFSQRKYDGTKVSWYSNLIDSLSINKDLEIYNEKKMKKSILNSYSNLLLKQYFGRKDNLKAYGTKIVKILTKEINVTEEILHNIPVYVLNIAYKDQKDTTRDQVEKHYIRKSDFLPIAFYSFLRWENMEQYNYYEIDYLALNPNIPLETFEIHENESINAKELYKNFKIKL